MHLAIVKACVVSVVKPPVDPSHIVTDPDALTYKEDYELKGFNSISGEFYTTYEYDDFESTSTIDENAFTSWDPVVFTDDFESTSTIDENAFTSWDPVVFADDYESTSTIDENAFTSWDTHVFADDYESTSTIDENAFTSYSSLHLFPLTFPLPLSD